MKWFAVLPMTLIAAAVAAHHGSNGQFDHNTKVEVSGVVTEMRFVNPHSYVYFDVTGDAGDIQPWRCEMRAGSALKRSGWSEEMFAPGTAVVINGSQARREEYGCYVDTIAFDSGLTVQRNEVIEEVVADSSNAAVVELAAGTPNISGGWERPPRVRPGGPPGAAGGMGAAGMGAPGMGGPGGGGSRYAKTALNDAETEAFNREMNPRFHCEATNIFHDWTFDAHVNIITQTDDTIEFRYGFMDIVRTIHMDRAEHPENIEPSRAGHSIGHWEDNTLVIDTVGFLPGWLEATFVGVRHGANMHTVERHTLSEDGQSLQLRYTINDPDYLAVPYTGEATVVRSLAPFDPYNCEDLTEEIVEGF